MATQPEGSSTAHGGTVTDFDVTVELDDLRGWLLFLDVAWTRQEQTPSCSVTNARLLLAADEAERLAGLLIGCAAQVRRSTEPEVG